MEALINPPKVDLASGMPVSEELKLKDKAQLIEYGREKMNLNIDANLDVDVIRNELLRIYKSQANNALELNARSVAMTVALDKTRKVYIEKLDGRKKKPFEYVPNPLVTVKFYNIQSPGLDFPFTNPQPYQMYGEVNKWGFKQMPQYHLYHGETYVLPLLLVKWLERLTYTTHIPRIDPATGQMTAGEIVIKPKIVLQQIVSDEENAMLAEFREKKAKEIQNGKTSGDDIQTV
jgi:hypothetical protein